jgi:O-antigen/teichoic acid export membrane protein
VTELAAQQHQARRPNLARSVMLNTVVQVAGRVVTVILGLLTIRLSTTYLGADGYGNLATIVTAATLLITLADLGLSTVLPRELARRPQQGDAVAGAMLRFRLLTTAAFVVATAALVPLLPFNGSVRKGLLIALVGVFFMSVGRVPGTFFQVNLRMGYSAILDVLYRVVALGLVAVAVAGDLGFYAVVLATSAASAAWAIASFVLSRRFWSINLRFAWAQARGLVRDSFALWGITVIGLLHFKSDTLVLAATRSPHEVGVYAVAYAFLEQTMFVPSVFIAVLFPILARHLVRRDDLEGPRVVQKAFQVLLLLAVPATLLLFFMPRVAIHLVSNAEFDSAATPLRILAFAFVPIFLNSLFFAVLVNLNKQRLLMVVAGTTLAVNTGLNLYLIPKYGYVAAAATTVFTESLGFVLSIFFAARARPLGLSPSLVARVSVAGIAGAAVGAILRSAPELVTGAAAVAAFFAVAVAARVLTLADIRLVIGRRGEAAASATASQ